MNRGLRGLAGVTAAFGVLLTTGKAPRAQTAAPAHGPTPLASELERRASAVEKDLLTWRRHLHQHPELSNREIKTAEYIAERLRSFGLEPTTGVARHGVVAILKGARPGPVIALRADMDGLPVKEEVDLPFASKATGEYEGRPVGVMHACGHDAHMAILLGTARILSELKNQVPGTIKFIFQPAEESAPAEERPAGAELMVKEGVLQNPAVEAIFGLHVFAGMPAGHVGYRGGPALAAADTFEIVVHGRQTHGAQPWSGVDPIVVGSQIVLALQTVISRQSNLTREPAVLTVGQFDAGVRNNIIPDRARLAGTIRTFDDRMQDDIHRRLKHTAEKIAESAGARAEVTIQRGYPITINDHTLTTRMLPVLRRVAGNKLFEAPKITGAEDFSFFQRQVPGLFIYLGVTPPADVATAAANHSPRFFVDESALLTGMRAMLHLTMDYLSARPSAAR